MTSCAWTSRAFIGHSQRLGSVRVGAQGLGARTDHHLDKPMGSIIRDGDEDLQKQGSSKLARQLQQPSHQMPQIAPSHADLSANRASQQNFDISTMAAQPLPDTSRRAPSHQMPQIVPGHADLSANRASQQDVDISTMAAQPLPDTSRRAPSHQIPQIVPGHADLSGNRASQQDVDISTMAAQPLPDTSGRASGTKFSGLADPSSGEFAFDRSASVAPRAPALDLAGPLASDDQVSPEQPPSWEPTIPLANLAQRLPEQFQMLPATSQQSMIRADAVLREMCARMLQAAMPDHYEE